MVANCCKQLLNISRSAESADSIKEIFFVKLMFAKHQLLLSRYILIDSKKSSRMSPISCCGRVVKALDLKSNGLCPRRFEPCQLR